MQLQIKCCKNLLLLKNIDYHNVYQTTYLFLNKCLFVSQNAYILWLQNILKNHVNKYLICTVKYIPITPHIWCCHDYILYFGEYEWQKFIVCTPCHLFNVQKCHTQVVPSVAHISGYKGIIANKVLSCNKLEIWFSRISDHIFQILLTYYPIYPISRIVVFNRSPFTSLHAIINQEQK